MVTRVSLWISVRTKHGPCDPGMVAGCGAQSGYRGSGSHFSVGD